MHERIPRFVPPVRLNSRKSNEIYFCQQLTALGARTNIDTVFNTLAPILSKAVGGIGIGVALIVKGTPQLLKVAHFWWQERDISRALQPLSASVFAEVLNRDQVYQTQAFYDQGVYRWFFNDPLLAQNPDVHSFIGCPLTTEEGILGVVFGFDTQLRTFTCDQIMLFELFTNRLALCLPATSPMPTFAPELMVHMIRMSQELRASTTNIKLAARLLDPQLSTKGSEYVHVITTECDRQIQLIRALLERPDVTPNDCITIPDLFERVRERLMPQLTSHSVRIRFVVAETLPTLNSHAPTLEWILGELVQRLLLTGPEVILRASCSPPWLYLSIQGGAGPEANVELTPIEYLVTRLGGKIYPFVQAQGHQYTLMFNLEA